MKFNKHVLKNGLRVVTVPMADNPSVTMLVMVETGSKYEDQKTNGLSHFLEHMVFKGTENRPNASDISRELDSIGSHYNAFTSQEYTGYYAKADARHTDRIIDVISDMYLNPVFDAKEIEKEKGVIIEELRMYKDLPQRHVHDLMTELLHGNTPAGWPIIGTEENIRSFNQNSFKKYRQEHYVSGATTVIVAGAINEKEIVSKIEKIFSKMSKKDNKTKLKVVEKQNKPAIKTELKETDQTHIVIGFRAFDVHDKRTHIMKALIGVLSGGMSSRLFYKMRDQLGICYYVRAEYDAYTDHGAVIISAGLDNSRVKDGITGILEECERLKTELVSDAELKKVKDYISGTTMLSLETSDSRAEYCGYEEILKGKIESPDEMVKKINSVTATQIRDLAKEIFVNKSLNLALIGKSKSEDISPYFKLK